MHIFWWIASDPCTPPTSAAASAHHLVNVPMHATSPQPLRARPLSLWFSGARVAGSGEFAVYNSGRCHAAPKHDHLQGSVAEHTEMGKDSD